MSLLATDDQHAGPRPGGVTGRGWTPGRSGNPAGRPPAPVDIAALAREHGPKCIEVAAALLEDPDPRIRLAALVALLDRGFGRPVQAIAASDNATSIQFQHLVAARLSSDVINRTRVIDGDAGVATETTSIDLMTPALE
jgi:hypothetical protein